MTKFTTLAAASLVAVTMATPDQAWAQARQRPSGTSAAPSGGGQGGSGGGAPSAGARQAPQGGPQGGPRTSGAQPRGGPTGALVGSSSGVYRGQAQPRPAYGSPGHNPGYGYGYPGHYYPSYGSYYPYYPYYSYYPYYPYSGWNVGFSFGVSSYWPYGYGSLGWGYPYGYGYGSGYYPGYAPYGGYYNPFFPYGYVAGSYVGGEGEGSGQHEVVVDHGRATGSVRLRVEPRHATVYVDGALAGTVDDFDGLTNHLDIEAGRHELEIRADGYETHRFEILVAAGRTLTARASLKKH